MIRHGEENALDTTPAQDAAPPKPAAAFLPRLKLPVGVGVGPAVLVMVLWILAPQVLPWLHSETWLTSVTAGILLVWLPLVLDALVKRLPLYQKAIRKQARAAALRSSEAEIKAKYADDKELEEREIMRLYKEQGANPLSGCFTFVVTFSLRVSVYWSLLVLLHAKLPGWAFTSFWGGVLVWFIVGLCARVPLGVAKMVIGAGAAGSAAEGRS
jgi:hypothetical protein